VHVPPELHIVGLASLSGIQPIENTTLALYEAVMTGQTQESTENGH